jgi:mannose-1-phosphate guanylyltransferase
LWNTFVCVAQATTWWDLTRQAAPDLFRAFRVIRRALRSDQAPRVTERVYETLRAVNFSSGVCEPLVSRLRVLRVPAVGWSDWGSVERIRASLETLGDRNAGLARRRSREGDAALGPP